MSRHLLRTTAVAAATCGLLAPALAASAAAGDGAGLAAARAATARYHDVDRAHADGYLPMPEGTPLHECIDADVDLDDTDGAPAMGVHLVNGALLDAEVEADRPEALVYEPTANGSLRLVALEYVVFDADWLQTGAAGAPELFGERFMTIGEPNRYEIPAFHALHAWVWKHNPDGMFAGMNPTVSCTHAGTAD